MNTPMNDDVARVLNVMINWCENTEKFLIEARRLKSQRKLHYDKDNLSKHRWWKNTQNLFTKIIEDLKKNEPEVFDNFDDTQVYYYVELFLFNISDQP
jgi:hypothetical protein